MQKALHTDPISSWEIQNAKKNEMVHEVLGRTSSRGQLDFGRGEEGKDGRGWLEKQKFLKAAQYLPGFKLQLLQKGCK